MHLVTFNQLAYTLYLWGNHASWVISESPVSEDVEDGLLAEFSFTVCTVYVSVEGLDLGKDECDQGEDVLGVVGSIKSEIVEEISDFLLCLFSCLSSNNKSLSCVKNGLRRNLVRDAGVDGFGLDIVGDGR